MSTIIFSVLCLWLANGVGNVKAEGDDEVQVTISIEELVKALAQPMASKGAGPQTDGKKGQSPVASKIGSKELETIIRDVVDLSLQANGEQASPEEVRKLVTALTPNQLANVVESLQEIKSEVGEENMGDPEEVSLTPQLLDKIVNDVVASSMMADGRLLSPDEITERVTKLSPQDLAQLIKSLEIMDKEQELEIPREGVDNLVSYMMIFLKRHGKDKDPEKVRNFITDMTAEKLEELIDLAV